MIGRLGFGARLRAHRERQGISLRSIAESTKIKFSLLDALERGDVSQWPHGLFRRAYLRDYAAAVNLPAEPLVAEFLQLFPEDGSDPAFEPVTAAPLRLTLDAPPVAVRVARRGVHAAIEAGAVTVAAGVATLASPLSFLESLGLIAIAYYPLAMSLADRTGVVHRLKSVLAQLGLPTAPAADAVTLEPARLYVVGRERPAQDYAPAVTGDDLAQSQTASR